jgi:hypothetical protein
LDPRRLNPRLTAEFVDMLADMMAKDPAQRIPSAAAVKERLKPWLPGGPLADADTTAVGSSGKHKPSHDTPSSSESPLPVDANSGASRLIAMPPVRRPAPRETKTSLPDTIIDFPELPQVSDSSESSASPPGLIVDLVDEEGSSTHELQLPDTSLLPKDIRPLMLLVFIPFAIVFGVVILWNLIAILFG